ncbi:uncharacterized protein LOC130549636 [Triplophysa rosa]|uniref:uncharacterized protein LOC130549636 n=1 Tax=Triplophysa rosa TaxID=992332 RepID=UPI0025463410|nr:uncharacterized protein LOC130549636 [Triplophysa rosa]
MEGHSVTLHTHTELHTHDVMVWRFKDIIIATIMRSDNINPTYDDNDETEMFRDRLKMNTQTGDLTITHITSQHSGLYHLYILRGNTERVKTFSLTVNGEVKSVSVMEGHSVTLHTHLTHIQRNDVMVWRFKHIIIATIMRSDNINPTYDDNDETEMFRDRLKMNNQTGDLTITHITSHHSGLYHLYILRGNTERVKTFSLTVNASDAHTPAGGLGSDLVILLSCAGGCVMIVTVFMIFCICRKHTNTQQEDHPHEKQIICADSSFYKHNTQISEMTEVVYTSIKQDHICTKEQLKYFSKAQYYVRINKKIK